MEEEKKPSARRFVRRLFRGKSKDEKTSPVSQPGGASLSSRHKSLNVDRGSRASVNKSDQEQHSRPPALVPGEISQEVDTLPTANNTALPSDNTHNGHFNSATNKNTPKQAAGEEVSSEIASDDQPYDLWSAAYDNLRETKSKMVVVYEKILSNLPHNDSNVEILENAPNILQNTRGQLRAERMKEIVDKALERAKIHALLKENIAKAVDFVKKAEGIVGNTLQAYPPAALAWSGICVLLQALMSPITQNKAMYNGLDHVMERMEWYIALTRLLLRESWKNDRDFNMLRNLLAQRIKDLYEALIEYQMKSVCRQFDTHAVVNGIGDIVAINDWESKLGIVKGLEDKVNRDFETYNSQSIVEELHQISSYSQHLGTIARLTRDIIEQIQRRQAADEEESWRVTESERSALISMFSASPYNSRMELNPLRVPGTCEWFRRHPRFQRWLASDDNGLLLVSADPGCGKSVLSRFLVEDELPNERKGATICYFFFKDNEEQQNIANALCALLHRLFSSKRKLLENLKTKIIEAGKKLKENWKTLWDIFVDACKDPAAGEIICVLDALDECESSGRGRLIDLLKSYFKANPKAKFLVTTRRYPGIVDEFDEFQSNYVRLAGEGKDEIDQIQHEIDLVVDFRVKELSKKRKLGDREQVIRNKLNEKGSEQRTYLWVRLVFEVLEKNFEDTKAAWVKQIERLPLTVAGNYEELLKRVPREKKGIVRDMLHIIIAAYRPLSIEEMNIALHIRGRQNIKDLDELDLMGNFRNSVIDTCGFFVTEYDDTLFLIHQTAKEFLLEVQTDGKNPPDVQDQPAPDGGWIWKNSATETMAHRILAESCISFLTMDCFNIDPLNINKSLYDLPYAKSEPNNVLSKMQEIPNFSLMYQKFLRYASRYWPDHFRIAQEVGENLTRIQDVGETYWPNYISLLDGKLGYKSVWLLEYASRGLDFFNPALNFSCGANVFAALFGHIRLLRDSTTKNFREESGHGHFDGYELLIASREGFEIGVQCILENGVGVDLQDPVSKETALHHAVLVGNHSIMTALLARKPLLEVHDIDGRTPLHLACRNGRADMVQMLLDHGAEVNTRNKSHYTPLHEMCGTKRADIVQMLLNHGAEVNIRDEFLSSPLHEACRTGRADIVQILLSIGADISAKNINERTPLHSASRSRDPDTVRLLVEGGADVNAKDNYKRTPLHCLCKRVLRDDGNAKKRLLIADSLVKNGADVNAMDDTGATALDLAKRHGQILADFLVRNGSKAEHGDGRLINISSSDDGHDSGRTRDISSSDNGFY